MSQVARLILRAVPSAPPENRLAGLRVLVQLLEAADPIFVTAMTSEPLWYECLLELLQDGGLASPSEAQHRERHTSHTGNDGHSSPMLGGVTGKVKEVGQKVGALG